MAAAQQAAMLHDDLLRRLYDEATAAAAAPRALFFLATLSSLVLLPLLLLRFVASTASARDDKLLSRLPSPPKKRPIIGHLHLMGALPHVSLAALAAEHGPDLMLLRLGTVPTVVASSPRAAEAILRTHDHIFASRPRSMVADIIVYGQSDSCYSPYGDHFRKVRKLVTVHLLNSKKVQSYRPAREEEVGLVMAKLATAAATRAVVDMSELLHSFVNDLVCRAVSGKFFREEGRNSLFRELIATNAVLLGGFNLEDYFPRLARLELLSRVICAKAKRVSKRWDQLLDKLIDDHVARAVRRVDDTNAVQEDSDFIDVLLSLQEEYELTRNHMKAILIAMFEAGTDTSYLVLEVAMAELMRQPHVMAKLQDEVRRCVPTGQEMVTESDLTVNNMTYLKAVVKETLRLHPPAPLFIPHLSVDTCDIDGYTIPAGTRVIVNGWAIGRLSSYWSNADEFLPERFIDTNDIDLKGKGFHYLPFGSGRRMCPGIHSAAATLEIMLANLMYRFDWELPAGVKKEDIDMTEVFGLTVHRKEKLFLVPRACSDLVVAAVVALHGAARLVTFFRLFPLLVLLAMARLLMRPSKQLEALSRIPSPPRLPIIGHLHLVGSLTHVSLRDLAAKHGRDDGLMLLRLGAVLTVIVSTPPPAGEAVLYTHDHVFTSRPFNPLADILAYGLLDVSFAPYGERWRQAKMLLTTHLLNVKKVRSFRGAREAEVRVAVAKARGAAAAGGARDLSPLLKAYTNDFMCRAVSGRFFFEDGRNRQIPELTDVVKDIFGAFKLQDYFPALARVDVLSRASLVKATAHRNRWDELFDTLIDFHVHRPQRRQDDDGDVEEEESDFIDVMLALKNEYGLTRNHIKAINLLLI
ncbi:indole-2-monooxygenase [Dichanthelium oligosanthes]|uniref:Indole-2-monooxygenase n=1 Tax=Dichanthelium oligosanthes TaxID=888268 RepID=A0A1E5UR76_9POAL|nr:indole-2-monooxygenase [Dichanthelium oligosanthes]